MNTLLFTSAAIFIVYIITILVIFGIPPSISETYYLVEEKRKGLGVIFTFSLWAIGFILLPYWVLHSPENTQFLAFLAASGIILTGAAKEFKGYERAAHFVGATTSAAASLLWLILNSLFLYPLIILPIVCIIAIINRQNWLFWLEIGTFTSLFSALILTNLII